MLKEVVAGDGIGLQVTVSESFMTYLASESSLLRHPSKQPGLTRLVSALVSANPGLPRPQVPRGRASFTMSDWHRAATS